MLDGRASEWHDAGGFFEWEPSEPLRGERRSLRIFHAELGDPDAPTLLLAHGFPTSSIDWADVAGRLSRSYRVCVLDFPGFGFSDKPQGESYTLARDAELVGHYLAEVVGSDSGAIVGHDRGDSVALMFAARCATGETGFTPSRLMLSNGNMFLPLSNLNPFQRLILDPQTAPEVVRNATPEMLAVGLGAGTFTPPRAADDPAVAALAQTFEWNDGMAVIHATVQYLVERSENEETWLDAMSRFPFGVTIAWGLYDVISPLRVAMHVWQTYLARRPGDNQLWLLPRANHYLQNDQPEEFAEVIERTLSGDAPDAPGPVSDAPGAPLMLDRSRETLPSAKAVLAGSGE